MRQQRLELTLGAHLAPFRKLCTDHGTSPQEVLRHFVARRLAERKLAITGGNPYGSRKAHPTRLQLKLKTPEMAALKSFALRENIGASTWMIQRLQDAMSADAGASVGREELTRMATVLDRLQRDIVGMAINLNQVARKVNSRVSPDEIIPEARLLVLKEIEAKMRGFVHTAQTILDRLDDPRTSPFPID